MLRLAFTFGCVLLLSMTAGIHAAWAAVDMETAAKIYQDAAMREQVRASLGTMPAHIRQMFSSDTAVKLSTSQINAVTKAAERGFRIDVFEAPALSALAANLDAATVQKTDTFLASDLGRRMVAADLATAALDEPTIDKIMSGDLAAPPTPKRDALFDKLEQASRSTESTVQIFLSMGQAVAIGTAVGASRDTAAVADSARKSGESGRIALETNMRAPLRRYMAYSYRDLSNADLKHLLSFLSSAPGQRYVTAYIASLGAGYDAMGRRCGEHLGESLRELAQAQLDVPIASPPPSIAAPAPPPPPPIK
ncbi:MAG: hypothetical protein ABJD53_02440 [Gammaproteobacteria bacterium]